MRFERTVRYAALKGNIIMSESLDPILSDTIKRRENQNKKLAEGLGLRWPLTLEEHEKAKGEARNNESKLWERLGSQGHGVREYRKDKIGNKWLAQPNLLSSSRFINAIRLRTNTLGTKVALARHTKQVDVNCRRCHEAVETLGHVLGLCIHTKNARIRRHDSIKEFIKKKIPSKYTIFKEPTINYLGELKKPKLVLCSKDTIKVVDVTIRYETGNRLQQAANEKLEKYKGVAELIRVKTGRTKKEVIPIVVGSRGVMPKDTIEKLKSLGINTNDQLTISLMALRSSIEIATKFIDYDKNQ